MNIVAYCRVSTEKDDQLNSLLTQKEFFEQYASKNNYNLIQIYADDGISGTKIKNRKQFQKLMKDAKLGLFQAVVVKDVSRFARNTLDFLSSIRALKALGIETIFLTSNQTVLNNSEFVLTIFGALAQEESANTSKRVKFGKKLNAQKGRVPNLVYGYNKIVGDYFNLTINEYEAKVVKRIFELYINGGYGANKIAQILNADGITTKRNCKWTQNSIVRILTNQLYTGRIINGKQEVADFLTGERKQNDTEEWIVKDKPELRIVDDKTFNYAAKILSKRITDFNINRQRQSNRHLFSTLIKCSCCGYSFRRLERVYKNTYTKWVCSGRNANGADSCINFTKIDENELLLVIKDYFSNILKSKENTIKAIIEQFNRIYCTSQSNVEYEKELSQKLNKACKSRQKYMDMYEDDIITREEMKQKLGNLNIEIEKYKRELEFIKYNINKNNQLEQILNSTFQDVETILLSGYVTNAHLKRIIEKIVVNEHGKIDIYLKLFDEIGLNDNILINSNCT